MLELFLGRRWWWVQLLLLGRRRWWLLLLVVLRRWWRDAIRLPLRLHTRIFPLRFLVLRLLPVQPSVPLPILPVLLPVLRRLVRQRVLRRNCLGGSCEGMARDMERMLSAATTIIVTRAKSGDSTRNVRSPQNNSGGRQGHSKRQRVSHASRKQHHTLWRFHA